MLEPQTMDRLALATKINHQEKENSYLPQLLGRDNQQRERKDNLWCTHCKKIRHTKETCWQLHGKAPSREWGKRWGQQRPKAHMTE